MSSCLNSWGDCGSAYHVPGRSRTGTRKSRAPSGVDLVRSGVSTWTKRRESITAAARYAARDRSRSASATSARLMSR